MSTTETTTSADAQQVGPDAVLQARLARLKDLAIAGGVKLVSEAELKEMQRQRRERRMNSKLGCRKPSTINSPPSTSRPARQPYKDEEREWEHPTTNIQQPTSNRPQDLEAEFQASGAADSANKILLEFFCEPKNFNQAFRSTDLEAMTARAGHGSSRMNNRAIWLREQVRADGLYLDNDPNGQAWGLPPGSYYRLCRIEDATSLSAEKKLKLLASLPK